MLAPVTEVHYGEVPLLGLNMRSAELYPRFVAELEEETGLDVDYSRDGILLIAKDTDDRAVVDELCAYQRDLGLEVESLSAQQCRSLEPLLAPAIRGGVLARSDAQVDTRKLGKALLEAARRNGAEFLEDAAAEIVLTPAGVVSGLATRAGKHISCGVVVVAAGCWSPLIEGIPPEAIPPVRPVKGQLMLLKKPDGVPGLGLTIRAVVHGRNVYLVKRSDGRVVLGGTVEEMGYDTSVTAGALLDLLRDAYDVVPTIVEYEVLETLAGLRPGSPDNAPILGESGIRGLIYATGHFRNGILLTPITAYAIAELVLEERVPEEIAPFGLRRFSEVQA